MSVPEAWKHTVERFRKDRAADMDTDLITVNTHTKTVSR